ncbi:MAG: DNA polymerase III subunit alpha [Saprospirales bacterium]|nr:MAG: DNA polymerase III subunit alpha [Saprospirales bacterium]
MPDFVHLHNHSQFSLLDGASSIEDMVRKAAEDGQKGVALTDHGNMFGAFKLVAEAGKKGIKPIIGCEFYLVKDRFKKSFSRKAGEKDQRFHQLLLAKNKTGYRNLIKLCSLGYMEGLYSDFPRIDKTLIEKYHEGVIATSCCIGAEVPQTILKGKVAEAEEKLLWWLDIFGEDYYIELQRHCGMENIDGSGYSQEDVNQVLLRFAKKHNVKVIATNDSHYLDKEDAFTHDILLCVNTGKKLAEDKRFKFPSDDFFFKTTEEMNKVFADIPEALDNTNEVLDKVDFLQLERDVLLPAYPLPEGFATQEDFLRHLTYEGAKKRYGELTAEITERLDFELKVINESGYPGYFLIVQDFTNAARKMGVAVGPGRGSAAGSAVAYCIGITNVDPIKYNLLFERFLNPERVSMPDIDIDFDDEGRSKIIDYVIEKYGRNQVAQIITYGTMAAKSSIRDVGRVMDLELKEVDRITKMFPAHPSASLNKLLKKEGVDPKLMADMRSEDQEKAVKFRELAQGNNPIARMLDSAKKLEGSVRNSGIHACAVVITPSDVTDYVPVSLGKGSDLLVSQFDNEVAERAGLLKMDFLGLKTLSIIKDAVRLIKQTRGIELDPEQVPLDDPKTYELFQRGETVGIFQYESDGMQKALKELKPNKFEDLIAMNALYRPGPLEYIPSFAARKNGREPIAYDLPEMEEFLAETYGITVYQEQVMLLSQKLAGFSKGEADALRKAMGKKKKEIIDQMFPKFLEGCLERGHPKETVLKIWRDWEKFAQYAFNKSHSTCYAFVAFQTAYLKANYPEEFMASVLSHNNNDISKINFFLREAKRMDVEVLPPDINESEADFTVKKEGQIRVGLTAIKGVGAGPVASIVEDRGDNGPFKTPTDVMKRLGLRQFNKKVFESLVLSGAMDSFGLPRSAYFEKSEKYESYIEHLLRFGQKYQEQKAKNMNSLFGDALEELIDEPPLPEAEPWDKLLELEKEREVVGIYLSGHPLDMYEIELKNFTDCELRQLDFVKKDGARGRVAGKVSAARHGVNKKGNGYCFFTLEDYHGSYDFRLFSEDYSRFGSLVAEGQVLHITGTFRKKYNSDELQFQIQTVKLLSTVAEEKIKALTLNLLIGQIDETLIERIKQLTDQYRGDQDLIVRVLEPEQKLDLELKSISNKVVVDNDFIRELERLNIKCSLN